MTDADVVAVAEKAANIYCRKYASVDQFDDALGEASLFLLEHRDVWNATTRAIVVRVVGALVRNYQNAHGLRLKNPPKFVDGLELDTFAASSRRSASVCDPRLTLVEDLLQSPLFAEYSTAILELVDGHSTKKEIAQRHGLRPRELTRIYKSFRRVVIANARGVTIVDPRDDADDPDVVASCPLFFA